MAGTKLEEQDIVRRAKSGDMDAFAVLVETHETKVYTLTLRMTGDREDARDLAQEAFLLAYRRLPALRMESSFATWLYRLTANLCIDFLRREKRRKTMTVSLEERIEQKEDWRSGWLEPQTELERREQRASLERGIASLSAEHKEILVLREIGGLSYDEIGALLRLEPGTVKSRLARARQQLRAYLLKEGNFFDRSSSKEVRKEMREEGAV